MRVQRVLMPASERESWTVVDGNGLVVEPIEDYLAYLAAIERSPTTVRAYAFSLKLWFEFLSARDVSWDTAGVEEVSRFVAWLRAPADNVVAIDGSASRLAARTVNRHLSGLFGFYDYQARRGVDLSARLVAWRGAGHRPYKPFLDHVTKGKPVRARPIKLTVPKKAPTTLTESEIRALLEACERLRDQFLLALLAETGMRVGQALGLRHSDFVSRDREVHIVPREDNANGARAKCRREVVLPVSRGLVRLYSEYMHVEYGTLDSDYVFVNLWGQPVGRPLSYQAVDGLVGRLRARTGIFFRPHMLRHSRATELVRQGVPIEVVSKLLTHRPVATTSEIYVHLDVDDTRAELVRAGVWAHEGTE